MIILFKKLPIVSSASFHAIVSADWFTVVGVIVPTFILKSVVFIQFSHVHFTWVSWADVLFIKNPKKLHSKIKMVTIAFLKTIKQGIKK